LNIRYKLVRGILGRRSYMQFVAVDFVRGTVKDIGTPGGMWMNCSFLYPFDGSMIAHFMPLGVSKEGSV